MIHATPQREQLEANLSKPSPAESGGHLQVPLLSIITLTTLLINILDSTLVRRF
jgi:hypothetical protein